MTTYDLYIKRNPKIALHDVELYRADTFIKELKEEFGSLVDHLGRIQFYIEKADRLWIGTISDPDPNQKNAIHLKMMHSDRIELVRIEE
jgi:hypothetical protein